MDDVMKSVRPDGWWVLKETHLNYTTLAQLHG
jgi:hypothetical protein